MKGRMGLSSAAQCGTSILYKCDEAFGGLLAALNAIGTLLIVMMISVMNADILGRYLFSHPVVGTTEIVEMSIVAVLFLQVAYTLRQGALVRSDVLIGALRQSRPRVAAVVETLYALIGAFVFAVLADAIWPILLREVATSDQFGTPGVFLYPKWPLRAAMLIGSIAMAVQFLIDATKHMKTALAGECEP